MSKQESLVVLWRLLVDLFGDKSKAGRLAEQSGLDPAQISADGSPADYWWRILVEAHRRNKVQELVKNASWEVEERSGDLKQAYRAYVDAPDTGVTLDTPGNATGPTGTHINTGGGAYIGGSVNTRGGDFVGRDKIVRGGQTNRIEDD